MNQKTLLIGATVLVTGMLALVLFTQGPLLFADPDGNPQVPDVTGGTDQTDAGNGDPGAGDEPRAANAEGMVTGIAASARVITLQSGGKEVEVAADEATKFYNENNAPANFAYLRRGFTIRASGDFSDDGRLVPAEVRVLRAPNVLLHSPRANEEVGLPLVITGEARTFENNVQYRILNEDGSVLVEGFTTAQSPDTGQYGPFEIRATYPKPKTNRGSVEVFEESARDGAEINKTSVQVRFRDVPSAEVKVFFGSSSRDPQGEFCERAYPVVRRIERTQSIARRAIEELLRGPYSNEARQGYFTSINSGVTVNSLTIQNGTARVDFDSQIEAGVGGSCRVTAIRAQIEETLKQFPTVERVVISVNGRTDDALQP